MVGPPATDELVRRRMQNTRSRDTPCELLLRKELHGRGHRYRVHYRPLRTIRRSADLVFTRRRVAVFVDGCFWHACPDHCKFPKANAEWWEEKLRGNAARDRMTDALLAEAGWIVVRIWEHESIDAAVQRVEAALKEHPGS